MSLRNPFAPPKGMRRRPGYRWRFLAHTDSGQHVEQEFKPGNRVCFDELVIDHWFHIEQTDDRNWYIRVADALMYVHVPSNGPPRLWIGRDDSWERTEKMKQEDGRS